MNRRGSLRARLAALYAWLLLGSGIVLLIIADLPFAVVSHTTAAHPGGSAGQSRFASNLPDLLTYSGIALAVLAVASIAVGWLIADRAMRPLRRITATARAISASSLRERLNLAGSYDELEDLGDTLDGLFARLEAAFESQRHFVANASHELRTPLAAERAVLQVALADPDASAESLRAACQQLLQLGQQQERLIDALLTLAAGQRELRNCQPVDLARVADWVVASRQEQAARARVRVAADLAPVTISGDPPLAEVLVANLMDNAIRHNVDGGQVRVTTAARDGGGCLSICNSGPVIQPDDVGRLLEPFRQLGGQRTRHDGGHGLGLAIVSAIASAHGATLDVQARPEGGLAVTVMFPLP
ncbi:MAG TPA: HAMP domain-containing sensor histidine kinase [Trebonia sp.]|nr:HAMP domain-containing sensor histidine kinase [Trebonia sp.]